MSCSKKRCLGLGLLLVCLLMVLPLDFQGREDKIMAYQQETINKFEQDPIVAVQNNSLKGTSGSNTEYRVKEEIFVLMTAYSSSIWETDNEIENDPFITASGSWVHWGTVAANFLPFGTKIRIPAVFGDEVFEVEDRMNARKKIQIDIWQPSREQALDFGVKMGYIEILEEI
jgi:3D (Asp-Asp-Asp) domain-containing protein